MRIGRGAVVSLVLSVLAVLMISDIAINRGEAFAPYFESFEYDDQESESPPVGVRRSETLLERSDLRHLILNVPAGTTVVRGTPDSCVIVSYDIAVFSRDQELAGRYVEQIGVNLQPGESSAELMIDEPPIRPERIRDVTLQLEVAVPHGVRLEVRGPTRLELRDVRGDVTADGLRGAEARNIRGDLDLDMSWGDVVALGISGSVKVKSGSTRISLSDISGDLELETWSRPGSLVEITDIGGDARIDCVFAPLSVSSVGGDLRIDAHGESVRVRGVRGSTFIDQEHGLVLVEGMQGQGTISNRGIAATVRDGLIRSDYNLNLEKATDGWQADGTIGSGRFDLSVMVEKGNFELLRLSGQ